MMMIILTYDIDSIHDMGEQGELFSLLHSGPACPAGFQVAECLKVFDDDHFITMKNQVSGSKCMKLGKTMLGWAAARNVCKEAGADLALVTKKMMMTIMIIMMMMMMMMMMGSC